MAEYKDVTGLKKQIADFKKSVKSSNSDYLTAYLSALSVVEGMIADLPTADVAEVKHGEWFSLTECSNAGVYCSVCHKKVYKEDYAWCSKRNKLRSNYCPNCGAKMDGGKAENNG